MSLNYFSKYQYEICPLKFQIEILEIKMRKEIHKFEIKPLKNRREIFYFRKQVINRYSNELDLYRDKIKGFNFEAFIIGFAFYHTSVIFYKRVLLYEMGRGAVLHMGLGAAIGIGMGYLIGYNYAKSYQLYKIFRNKKRNFKKLNEDFEYFYVGKHEQEFDE